MIKAKRLFRYFDPAASNIFAEGRLWLSAACDFNDLFEVVPRFDKLVPQLVEHGMKVNFSFLDPSINVDWLTYKKNMAPAMKLLTEENVQVLPVGLQKKFSQHFGIICFCENGESVLMWGHYTKSHRGFVVEFDPAHAMFSPTEVGKVNYSMERPYADDKDYSKILLTKSPEWDYEQEYRLIKPFHEAQKAKRRDGLEKYFVPLPLDAVRAVYFGNRIDDKTVSELLKSLELPQSKHITPYIMTLHQTEFRLVPTPWKNYKPPSPGAFKDFDGVWRAVGL